MALVNKLIAYRQEAIKEQVNDGTQQEDLSKFVKQQIDTITSRLTEEAQKGNSEVRFMSNSLLPQTVQFFIDEDFIVWQNSSVVVVKIPLQHNY